MSHNIDIRKAEIMLPDFLKTKEKLKIMIDSERKKSELLHRGAFADTSKSNLFEGDEVILIQADGSSDEVKMEKAEVKIEIKLEEIEEMTHEKVLDKIDTMAREMAGKIAKSLYDTMSEAAEKGGNVISVDGKSLSIDLLLKEVEKMHLSFDEEGQPSGITFVAQSDPTTSIDDIWLQIKSHPRFPSIMEQKREEWYARESNRKLVG